MRIYSDPLQNIPGPVRAGALDTLAQALNVRNRNNKRAKFGFETSEDAVTWTVFTYLHAARRLAAFQAMSHVVASRLGPPEATLRAPFYGLTIPRMNRVCQSLTLLRALDSYGDMEEDSCVIFYFAMLDQWRQVRLGLRQRDESGRLQRFDFLMHDVGENDSEGPSSLSPVAPFSGIDPYHHFMTFELQLSHNRAISNPSVKLNQADVVITDVGRRCLYVVEAKMTANPDEEQLSRLLDSIAALTDPGSASVFRGYHGIPILLLNRPDASPVMYDGQGLSVVTWGEIARVVSDIGVGA